MRIFAASDLHFETRRTITVGDAGRRSSGMASASHAPWLPDLPKPREFDVLVLVGDIDTHPCLLDTLGRLADYAAGKPVLFVPGNHEYYNEENAPLASVEELEGRWAEQAGDLGFHFLQNDSCVIDGVRFIGSTLWTDFGACGQSRRASAMGEARRRISDFYTIRLAPASQTAISPEDMIALNHASRAYIRSALSDCAEDRCVVLTHFPPLLAAQNPAFAVSNPLTPYFYNDLSALIAEHREKIATWIFGHHHYSVDLELHGVRFYSNQLGYPNEGSGEFRYQVGYRPQVITL